MALLKPKGKRNRENKLNLNEGTILCLLDKNKANFRNAKMNENLLATKDYKNETAFRPQKKQNQSKPLRR